jgi:hypothetical protein
MAINEEKNALWIFGVLFLSTVIIGLLSFLIFGLHYIGYEYAIKPISNLSNIGLNATGVAQTQATAHATQYLGIVVWYDYLFLLFFVGIVVTSIYTALMSRRIGMFSFFGMFTLGILLFSIVMSYAIQIKTWIISELTMKVLSVNINAPIFNFIVDNIYVIYLIWFCLIVLLSFIDIPTITAKLFQRQSEEQQTRGQQDLSTSNVDSMFNNGEQQQ